MTNFENDPGQTPSGSYQPWPAETSGYPAQQYPVAPQQPVEQYPPQYQQHYPQQQYQPQYQQQYPQQYQPYQPTPYSYPAAPRTNGLGTAGFVCGLLGVVLFWIPFLGLILAALGVVLGGTGMAAGRRDGSGTGLAIAGLVLGLVGLVPAIFWIGFAVNA